jgi:hypothetical protein
MTDAPIRFRWVGDAFVPAAPRWAKQCDRQFVIGEEYMLIEEPAHSDNSRRHYFAALREAWLNLPESVADQYATVEILRKKALIRCGYADEQQFVCTSKVEAARLQAFMLPIDQYAIVAAKECVVTRYTAKSQSKRAMGNKDFQASKDAVLDYVASLIGTTKDALGKAP